MQHEDARVLMAQVTQSVERSTQRGAHGDETPSTSGRERGTTDVAQVPVRIGRYLVIGRLGAGGSGVVLAAYDPDLDRRVAIKLLRAQSSVEASGRLLREAQALARLSHPNVVQIYDAGIHDDQVFLAMELVAGRNLRCWLDESPRSWRTILRTFVEAGRGLAAAHRAGLIHRDFKPENVILGEDGRARVADFGHARQSAVVAESTTAAAAIAVRADTFAVPLTLSGAILGTPAYMSPEQFEGIRADARSDIFSFCLALHEALYGRRPFVGADLQALLAAMRSAQISEPPPSSPVPRRIFALLRRGLAYSPAARPEDMEALLADLSDDPGARRGRWALAAGLVIATSAATRVLTASPEVEPVPCTDDLNADPCLAVDAELIDLWDEPTRRRAEANLLGSGLSNAAEVWQHLAPRIDDAVASWRLARQQTCRALHARGPAPPPFGDEADDGGLGHVTDDTLRLRELCLLRRRAELEGITGLLRESDHDMLLATIPALDQRTPLTACDDPESLRRELASIVTSDELLTRESLLHQLLTLLPRAQNDAAGTLLPQILHLTTVVAARDDPGLHAHALHLRGVAERSLGRYDAAAASLTSAVHEALAARHDRLHAELAVLLVRIHAIERTDPDRAEAWAEHADAAVRAIGGDPILGPRLLDLRGAIAHFREDYVTSERFHSEAIARRGPNSQLSIDNASSHQQFGVSLLLRRQHVAAELHFTEALNLYRAIFGPHHRHVAATLAGIGLAHTHAGRLEQGVALLRDALALNERIHGRDHIALLTILNDLGAALGELGRNAEARAYYQRALSLGERHFGADHPRLWFMFHNLAYEALAMGDHAECIRLSTRAIDLQRRLQGDDHPRLAASMDLLARAQLGAGHREEAAATVERALVQLRKGPLPPPDYADILLAVAWVRHQTGAPQQLVRPLVEEVERLLQTPPGPSPSQQRELLALRAPS